MDTAHLKILIVDDEEEILRLLTTVFEKEGFQHVKTCTTAEQALRLIGSEAFDLILLDVMLPDKSGFDIFPFIKEKTDAPIFFLTAKDSDLDKLSGFAYGADDYITKPFNPLEIIARSKAILRRTNMQSKKVDEEDTVLHFGHFHIDLNTAELFVRNKKVSCTAQVFQLLTYFCKNPNRILTKEQIYENVWGGSGEFVDDNTIMVHIHKIRNKIEENPKNPKILQTVRGLGYRMVKRN